MVKSIKYRNNSAMSLKKLLKIIIPPNKRISEISSYLKKILINHLNLKYNLLNFYRPDNNFQ